MEQWPMCVPSYVATLTDFSYSFSSVAPVRQRFNRYTTAIFYCCPGDYVPTGP